VNLNGLYCSDVQVIRRILGRPRELGARGVTQLVEITGRSVPAATGMSRYVLLGTLCAIPLSITIEDRETFILHFFLFIPLSILIIFHGRRYWTRLTGIDGLVILYFCWAAMSFIVNLMASAWGGDYGSIGPRITSVGATILYWIIPFLIGRVVFNSDEAIRAFFDGLMIGALATAIVLLANYAYIWTTEWEMVRYAIGQRVVVGVCFLSMIFIFLYRLRFCACLGVFLLWLVIALSETRAAFLQLGIGLFLVILTGQILRKRQKAALVFLASVAVVVALYTGFAATRIEWMLDLVGSIGEGGAPSEEHSTLIRLLVWDAVTSKVFQDLPSAILGFGQLGPAYVIEGFRYLNLDIERFSAHSEYLDQMTRGGIVYLALFLVLYVGVVALSFRVAKYSPLLGPAYRGVAIGLIGAAVYAIFHESVRYPWFGVMFWILVGGLSNFWGRVRKTRRIREVAYNVPSVRSA